MGERFMYKITYGKELAKQLKEEVGLDNLRKLDKNLRGMSSQNQIEDEESSNSKPSDYGSQDSSDGSEIQNLPGIFTIE